MAGVGRQCLPEIAPQGHFLALRAQGATAPAEPRNDKSGSLPHPEGRNDKARSAPLPCHCEEGVSPTWQSQAGTYESAGAFLCSSQSCEIATAPAEPRNDKSGSLPHPEGRNDKARSAPLPCHCEEGVSPTWQSQAGTYESAGAFLCSSQSCEIATAPAEPRNDKSGSLPLNVQKAPRVRRSDCRKSLAEFAPAGAKKMEIIFSGGVYVGENTARLANVRRACPSCAAASRSPFQTRAQ